MCRNNPRIALLVATLAGCSTFDPPAPVPIRHAAFVHVDLVDSFADPSQRGQAVCTGSVCQVQILRKHYPFCLQHEMRHVFEGAWHGDLKTTADCD